MNPIDIYYLPGRGGRLHKGLGEALIARGFNLLGRETVGEFAALAFHDQIELVANDLKKMFWHERAAVIANSYGAYLFLPAQSLLASYPGRVLLLSPIVGAFSNTETGTHFLPPRSRQLAKLIEESKYAVPSNCEIHVGEHDWQSNPDNVMQLAKALRLAVHVVSGAGHMLPKDYVNEVLDNWLIKSNK